jgi:hypothetical protein
VIGLAVGLLVVLSIAVGRFLRLAAPPEPRPCYRCADLATTEYMSLPYCMMCRVVIVQVLPMVRHDPPYGFPGSTGYLEFPVEKKEI